MANMESSLLRTHDGEKELDKIYKVNVSPLSPKTQQGSRTLSNRSENSIRLANLKDANKRSESHRLSKTSSVDDEYLPVELQSERMDSLTINKLNSNARAGQLTRQATPRQRPLLTDKARADRRKH